ncbi:hypothetical protein PUR61_16155 [Streptomyces sp. BE20]|uniref:hypothetical protein n=1 Tax=Streptomyces sp. BE20 TaxID=3002525 RepID=UPI002E77EBB5|nr:hypothetical protein [Streptomyces sp. BE20]MEE1823712.1 hypothetical protein [Streptomyces sp. BE20]
MSKMTGGSARHWHPGMTTASKDDIVYLTRKQLRSYRRAGFTWAEIKKLDRAVGRGEREITIRSATREITVILEG